MKPAAIICSDLHLRLQAPRCRTDDWLKAQKIAVNFLTNLQRKHNVPIICAGDLFDKAKVEQSLERWAIENLPDNIVTVPGQHDLPNHNLELFNNSSLGVLQACKKVKVHPYKTTSYLNNEVIIYSYPFGINLRQLEKKISKYNILLTHYYVYQGDKPFPGISDEYHCNSFIKKLDSYDLIITGDNHIPFTAKRENTLLVNPGSMMRLKADQEDHEPRFYLWYPKINKVIPQYLPIKQGVITREHINKKVQFSTNMHECVNSLKRKQTVIDFKQNLTIHMRKNNIHPKVMQFIWECYESKE